MKAASTAQCGWCFFAYIIKQLMYILCPNYYVYIFFEVKPIMSICIVDILKTYWYSRLYNFLERGVLKPYFI